MNKLHKVFVLFCCISLLYTGCKKEEEINKLPPATAIGLGTFGCLVNGKAWPIYEKGFHYVDVYYTNKILRLDYQIKEDEFSFIDKEWVGITIKELTSSGIYIIPYNDLAKGSFSVKQKGSICFSTDLVNNSGSAYVEITRLDSANGIVSGKFNFGLFTESGSSYLKIESGRFDIQLP
jgi:hypothetical protein